MTGMTNRPRLAPEALEQLRRLTTPTVHNGWEQVTRRDTSADGFNLEDVRDFAPHLGPMVGYAVTAVIGPGSAARAEDNVGAWAAFRQYVARQAGPKVVVVQDLSKPRVLGSMWGEVGATIYRALGCVGTITDGGVRDVDEMAAAGFKAMAGRLCVGHGYGTLLRWGGGVEVFGRAVEPGQLIHADQHGFLAIPPEDEERLLEATLFMDRNEKKILAAARNEGRPPDGEHLTRIDAAVEEFVRGARARYGRTGEHA